MSLLPAHVNIEGFSVVDNCLAVGGQKLTALVEQAGSTPLYIYDRSVIERKIADLRRTLPDAIKLHYAIKANPMAELVSFIAGLVDGLDVASAGELDIALRTATSPAEISFAGPGKRDVELAAAISAGVVLNVESENELARISTIAKAQNREAKVALRVNPDFELKSSGMKMSGGPKPFGIDAEQIPDLLGRLAEYQVSFQGFHIFCGSQNLRSEAIIEAQNKSVELALALCEHAPPPRFLNIGGGFGIPYFPGEQPLDLEPIGENLKALLEQVEHRLPDSEVVIELGRYLVGECGLFVTRVIDKKESRGTTFLVTDGGLNNHLAASGNFGQILRKNYPVVLGNRITDPENQRVTVVGPLCTPLDILADKMELPATEIDDLIVIMQSGAYGFSASPHRFLGHPEPLEILV